MAAGEGEEEEEEAILAVIREPWAVRRLSRHHSRRR
ncbi:MAG: hypothetical protein ACI9NG_002189, partial [Hyphomonas sp.]